MCKLTRNAHSTALAARRGQLAHPPPHIIHAKEQQLDEKVAQLPEGGCKESHVVRVEEMVMVKNRDRASKHDGSSSSTAVARPHAPTAVAAPSSQASGANVSDSASASLRAISALCLPEAPDVVTGALIRECLLGQVNIGTYALGNKQFLPVVVKEFNLTQVLNKTTKTGHGLHEDALSELQIHAYIQKKQIKNVIGLYAMYLNMPANKLFAYLEYAAKSELFSVVQARGTAALPHAVASNFFVQLLQGIHELHAINVVHRDLSLENVLLTQDNEVKICDFGLAAICAPGATIKDGRVVGKVKYMCPELYYGEEYDPRLVDIWSAGVIFFLMLTGVFPYERPSADDPRLVMLCHGQINELLAHWKRPGLDAELLQVFSKMFCPPQQRWTAQQLLQLPFCQRFANVSKSSIATILGDGDASSKLSNMNCSSDSMSSEQICTPSPCTSTGSKTDDSAITSPELSFRTSASVSPTPSFDRSQCSPVLERHGQALAAVVPCS